MEIPPTPPATVRQLKATIAADWVTDACEIYIVMPDRTEIPAEDIGVDMDGKITIIAKRRNSTGHVDESAPDITEEHLHEIGSEGFTAELRRMANNLALVAEHQQFSSEFAALHFRFALQNLIQILPRRPIFEHEIAQVRASLSRQGA